MLGNIPNKYFETNGELRIYIVVTDGTASITTYEGKLHICQRSMPDDYVDDDPENEAVRVLIEAQEAAQQATEQAEASAASAQQAREILDSIPEDYTQLTEDVSDLKDDLTAVESDVTDLKDGLDAVETQLEQTTADALAAYVTDTASGSIASFSDGADNVPVKSLTVDIEPVQSGSGDPSPTNIRPISGHTQAVVTRCGKNLADFTDGYTIPGTGLPSSYAKRSATLTPIPIAEGKAYRFLCTGIHICGIYSVLDAENNLVRRVTGVDSETVLNTSGGAYLYVCGYDASDTVTVTADGNTLMVVFDTETDTTYEPYNGQQYAIDLNGTVYGGTLDVTTGVLTVDRAYYTTTLSTKDNVATGTYDQYIFYSRWTGGYISTEVDADASIRPICNIAPYLYSNAQTSTHFYVTSTGFQVFVPSGTAETTAVEIAYFLKEPFEVTLTAQEVRTLLGTNNVFADCGDVNVEYRADTKLYIQKVISG